MSIILIRCVIIYFFVMLAVRVMGKRQVGQLKPQELVITILISAVATIPLEQTSISLMNSLLPILIFISLEILDSALSMKSLAFRNLMQGKPMFIIKDGTLQQKELRRLRFTVDDLLDALRQKDVFDISAVQNAVVETNGILSVQKKAQYSPLTPQALGIATEEVTFPTPVVMDGKAVGDYFANVTVSDSEITLITKSLQQESESLLLLTLDDNGATYAVKKENTK